MNTLGNKKAELFDMGGGVGEPTAEENVRMTSGPGARKDWIVWWCCVGITVLIMELINNVAKAHAFKEQWVSPVILVFCSFSMLWGCRVTFCSVMAIVTCLVGLHYGHIIVHFKDHRVRMLYWMIPSSCLVVCGLTLDLFGMHINKVLYSFSYTCVTAGAAGILFVGTYLMVRYLILSYFSHLLLQLIAELLISR
ncbi:hypothetical protein RIF29_24717 [Crotalaria pallida]|uniref:Uncharacterized protein n=1 Tax=Crotalaria pallida TaxID=3830 RepID=A0AAN9HZ60_CROPI